MRGRIAGTAQGRAQAGRVSRCQGGSQHRTSVGGHADPGLRKCQVVGGWLSPSTGARSALSVNRHALGNAMGPGLWCCCEAL
jgi:hypothetical protein